MKKSSSLLVGAVALLFMGAPTDAWAHECPKPTDPIACFCVHERYGIVATGVVALEEGVTGVEVVSVLVDTTGELVVGAFVVPSYASWSFGPTAAGQRVLLTNRDTSSAQLIATLAARDDTLTNIAVRAFPECTTAVDLDELAVLLAETKRCRRDIADAYDLSKSTPCDVGTCGAASAWSDLTLGLLAAVGLLGTRRSDRTQRARP